VAAGTHDMPMTVVVDGASHPVNVVGVTDGFQQIRRLVIVRGRYLDQDDMLSNSKVCLMTQELSNLVFPNDDPIGKDIRLGDLHFTVIGVFRERTATFGLTEISRNSVVVPIGLIKYYTGEDFLRTFYAQADRAEDVAKLTKDVPEFLQSRHRTGAEYRVENLGSLLESARQISMALTVLLIVIALIALTISGVGIMNIMLVTVTERTREIGVRKALGAKRKDILLQFLIESALLATIGGFIGVLLGIGLAKVLTLAIGFPSVVAIWSIAVALIAATSVGLFFGIYPAHKASALDPIAALRAEL
jgi:putative ABC transport system permease protein